MVIYSICRLLFFLFNISYFSSYSTLSILSVFIAGLRFDITAIIISNVPFIALHFLPAAVLNRKIFRNTVFIVFIIINSVAVLLNCIDLILFRFAGKRATMDVVRIMSYGEDFKNTVPVMIRDFWYVLIFLAFLCLGMAWAYRKLPVNRKGNYIGSRFSPWLLTPARYLIFSILIVIGFRGGIQFKPVNILTAQQYGSGNLTALILNTPFTLIKTWGKSSLPEVHYYPEDVLEKMYPVIHIPKDTVPFAHRNVMVLILESFGSEYTGFLNGGKGYTPFLDSLASQSLVFTDAFANGKRSIEGIPAIIAGIPALMTEPFITSGYSGNKITSLASLLKTKGYHCSFFHGGTNGTMGFDNFTRLAGFDRYFGRTEFKDDRYFDGTWGIYDEPFLQRVAMELGHEHGPFLAVAFTLSSHHPYLVPEAYRAQLPSGSLPIHKSIAYADLSLKAFFIRASKQAWFRNTLFVLTADHTALSEKTYYQSRRGMYSIPLIIFDPAAPHHLTDTTTTGQIDILPTLMGLLHYDKPYIAFGSNVLDRKAKHFAVNYLNETYQLTEGTYSYIYDDPGTSALYNLPGDSAMQHNIIAEKPDKGREMQFFLRAIIQQFNNRMNKNKLSLE